MDEFKLVDAVKDNNLELVREIVGDIRANGSIVDVSVPVSIAINNGYYDILKELLLVPNARILPVVDEIDGTNLISDLIIENDDAIAYNMILDYTKLKHLFGYDIGKSVRRMIRKDKPNLLNALLTRSRRSIDMFFDDYNPPLIYAIKRGASIDVGEVLIEHGADPNEVNSYDDHVLTFAKDLDWIKFLIENGSDINYRLTDNHTPLHEIILSNYEIVNYVLDQGGNVAWRDNGGTSPLHVGIQDISLEELTRILNEYNPEIFADVSETGQTVVHNLIDIDGYSDDDSDYDSNDGSNSVLRNVIDKLKLLFFYGVDLTMLNANGRTPLQFMEYNLKFDPFSFKFVRNEIIRILKEMMDPSLALLSHRSIVRNNVDISLLPPTLTL